MKWLFSDRAFVIASYVFLIFSMIGFTFGILQIYPKGEPAVILGISWLALVFSSYGNIISSKIKRDMK